MLKDNYIHLIIPKKLMRKADCIVPECLNTLICGQFGICGISERVTPRATSYLPSLVCPLNMALMLVLSGTTTSFGSTVWLNFRYMPAP